MTEKKIKRNPKRRIIKEEKELKLAELENIRKSLKCSTDQLKTAATDNQNFIERLKVLDKKVSVSIDKNDKVLFSLKKQMEEFNKKLESFEESLLFIMHNIKKNQFLYAHYPDDWVKEYVDVKNGMRYENNYMNKKSKNKKAS